MDVLMRSPGSAPAADLRGLTSSEETPPDLTDKLVILGYRSQAGLFKLVKLGLCCHLLSYLA